MVFDLQINSSLSDTYERYGFNAYCDNLVDLLCQMGYVQIPVTHPVFNDNGVMALFLEVTTKYESQFNNDHDISVVQDKENVTLTLNNDVGRSVSGIV
ncbi:MAG: hypothetical protein B0D91_07665 [Oceanospirillales bacterium LUC14_002_19_P2]|nr:MAG: hypothetical protein B0D91_07665 [Oceanospirillales bacterium LUC14_002_19_P2]